MGNKKVLITGGKGFLGINIIKYFKALGYTTYGIGHGTFNPNELEVIGLDFWNSDEITIAALAQFQQKFDVIIHCGGGGSVGFSMLEPYQDFKKTVQGTIEVLEFMRLYNSKAHLIYPSSPAAQGEHPRYAINEKYQGKPVSPYGYHKKITEDLCHSYSDQFNLKISIIRLFSVYGTGLRKQILWDAYCKLRDATEVVEFWGTGTEIRDFIHIDDVGAIVLKLLKIDNRFMIINGGTGKSYTIKFIVESMRAILKKNNVEISFNQEVNYGNPDYYCADMKELKKIGFNPTKNLENELKNYVLWANSLREGE